MFDFWVRFLCDFLQKAPNRRIAHIKKIKPKIQTQTSNTFPNPGVRFWKGVGRWWGCRVVYGWLLVGSRQGKQGYRTQLLISSLSLPPLHRLFGVLWVPSLKHPKLKKKKKTKYSPPRSKINSGRFAGQLFVWFFRLLLWIRPLLTEPKNRTFWKFHFQSPEIPFLTPSMGPRNGDFNGSMLGVKIRKVWVSIKFLSAKFGLDSRKLLIFWGTGLEGLGSLYRDSLALGPKTPPPNPHQNSLLECLPNCLCHPQERLIILFRSNLCNEGKCAAVELQKLPWQLLPCGA